MGLFKKCPEKYQGFTSVLDPNININNIEKNYSSWDLPASYPNINYFYQLSVLS